MDWAVFWAAIGGIAGILSFFLSLYLGWPEILERTRFSVDEENTPDQHKENKARIGCITSLLSIPVTIIAMYIWANQAINWKNVSTILEETGTIISNAAISSTIWACGAIGITLVVAGILLGISKLIEGIGKLINRD